MLGWSTPLLRMNRDDMGWILVNIVLPISLPLVYMLAAKLVDLAPEVRVRTRLLRAVQDGQLGWVTMGFSASCAYDIVHYTNDGKAHGLAWLPAALALSLALLTLAGFFAALGTLFPVDVALPPPRSSGAWFRRYRLFVTTAACTLVSASIFATVHVKLS